MVFLIFDAVIRIATNTKSAPKLEAIANAQWDVEYAYKLLPNNEFPKISNATPKLAPEEIPKTKGPANGFLKSVCIIKPLILRPEPTRIAVMALGILKLSIINSQLSLEASFPKITARISEKGIFTEPRDILKRNRRIRMIPNARNCLLYV